MSTSRVNLDITQYVRVTSDPFTPSSLLLQSHRDTVRVAFSDVKPARDNKVFHELGEKDGIQNIPMTEVAVWALAMTNESTLTVTEQRSPVKVDEDFLYTDVRALSRVDLNILTSDMWSGYVIREDASANSEIVRVIRTGSKWLIIEDINVVIDFSDISNGRYTFELSMYVGLSNGNTFSYDENTGVVSPMGRNLNASSINTPTESVLETDPSNVFYTGDPDFQLNFSEYFLETQGNRESLTENGSDFFEGDRRLQIPPNSEVMMLATTTGDASGVANIRSNFFVSEAINLSEE